jgi:Ca2+-binding EF-hand superfamily protein
MLSVTEIVPELATGGIRPPVTLNQNEVVAKFILAMPQQPATHLAHTLLHYYDRDKDFHLTRAESGLDAEAFQKLDRDGNGKLDVPELADWFVHGPPDLELKVSFHKTGATGWAEVQSIRKEVVSLKSQTDGMVRVRLGDIDLTIGAGDSSVYSPLRGSLGESQKMALRQSFLQLSNNKGYIEASDLIGGRAPFLAHAMVMGDRNGDGKLTVEEFNAYLDVIFQTMETGLGFTVYSQTRNWFNALDADGDGRLSRKELQNAWKSLTSYLDVDGDIIDGIGNATEMRMILHRGPAVYQNYRVAGTPIAAPPAPARGPLWFRKMDRNGDGYVSRKEFLGTKEEFDRIDTDHDGLISPEEAEAVTPKK